MGGEKSFDNGDNGYDEPKKVEDETITEPASQAQRARISRDHRR